MSDGLLKGSSEKYEMHRSDQRAGKFLGNDGHRSKISTKNIIGLITIDVRREKFKYHLYYF